MKSALFHPRSTIFDPRSTILDPRSLIPDPAPLFAVELGQGVEAARVGRGRFLGRQGRFRAIEARFICGDLCQYRSGPANEGPAIRGSLFPTGRPGGHARQVKGIVMRNHRFLVNRARKSTETLRTTDATEKIFIIISVESVVLSALSGRNHYAKITKNR